MSRLDRLRCLPGSLRSFRLLRIFLSPSSSTPALCPARIFLKVLLGYDELLLSFFPGREGMGRFILSRVSRRPVMEKPRAQSSPRGESPSRAAVFTSGADACY